MKKEQKFKIRKWWAIYNQITYAVILKPTTLISFPSFSWYRKSYISWELQCNTTAWSSYSCTL